MPTDMIEPLVEELLVIHTCMLVINLHALILADYPLFQNAAALLRDWDRAGIHQNLAHCSIWESLGVQSHWEDLGGVIGGSKGCCGHRLLPAAP